MPFVIGLTAETVIGALEDAEDYKAFEAAITADYDTQSAVERELVLRLASLLWRLRRATTITILPLSSRVAFYVSPICLTTRSTASADMKQPFWRQVRQILFALDAPDHRKPQDGGRRFRLGSRQGLPAYDPEAC